MDVMAVASLAVTAMLNSGLRLSNGNTPPRLQPATPQAAAERP
jgi:hypothetical protein